MLTYLLLELVLSVESETEECFFREPAPAVCNILYCLKGSWEASYLRDSKENLKEYVKVGQQHLFQGMWLEHNSDI